MDVPASIRPLAAAHLRDALTAATEQRLPDAVGALMSIDSESWTAIAARLRELGTSVPALIARATEGTAPDA
ncbi:hypothetical protein [Streptacidiphilus rugosus]|uniref:hypothetical protein n=1 Tax=Streptacidiphilus rugosus TaxID=405783 RepID=UPI00056B45FD|nr:hypothetical protein [Streptacidiphilus rugosus]